MCACSFGCYSNRPRVVGGYVERNEFTPVPWVVSSRSLSLNTPLTLCTSIIENDLFSWKNLHFFVDADKKKD